MANASIPFVCEKCGERFAPADGGMCAVCGRVLCASHLRGLRRILSPSMFSYRGKQPVCPDCRKQEESNREKPSGPA